MGNDGKVSKDLQQRRYAQKYKHILDSRKYDDAIFNSGGTEFFAMSQPRVRSRIDKPYTQLDAFTYRYDFRGKRTDEMTYQYQGVIIDYAITSALKDFLQRAQNGETFVIANGNRSNYHLEFGKRGLFGQTELSWNLLYTKEEWDKLLSLPAKKRKEEQEDRKNIEKRNRFWFDKQEANHLALYLDFLL